MFNNLYANWPNPANISALTTTRLGGLNLHVGDAPKHVLANRQALITSLNLPASPEWLEQTHGIECVVVEKDKNRRADAAITRLPQHVLAILTADCLPILLCNRQGFEIAAIHAGWRGLAAGIIENTVANMQSEARDIIVWLGPAICQSCFAVGGEVLDQFTDNYDFAARYFLPNGNKWYADLTLLAKAIFNSLNIHSVFQANACTYERKNEFYSYRRDQQTGRMASLIWFNQNK